MYYNEDDRRWPVAFLRPYSEDWYDLFHLETWWEAEAYALGLAARTADCEFVGGPPVETEHLDSPRSF